MADEKVMKQAQMVYETLCKALDNRQWRYTRHDEDMTITCGARGEDIPMDFIIIVNPEAQVVSLYSPMPFKVEEDKRVDMALATSIANNGLINGSFDYNLGNGEIRFRICESFRGSILGEEVIDYLVMVSAGTIDNYNDKFMMIAKGMMSIQQFIEWENSRRGK